MMEAEVPAAHSFVGVGINVIICDTTNGQRKKGCIYLKVLRKAEYLYSGMGSVKVRILTH